MSRNGSISQVDTDVIKERLSKNRNLLLNEKITFSMFKDGFKLLFSERYQEVLFIGLIGIAWIIFFTVRISTLPSSLDDSETALDALVRSKEVHRLATRLVLCEVGSVSLSHAVEERVYVSNKLWNVINLFDESVDMLIDGTGDVPAVATRHTDQYNLLFVPQCVRELEDTCLTSSSDTSLHSLLSSFSQNVRELVFREREEHEAASSVSGTSIGVAADNDLYVTVNETAWLDVSGGLGKMIDVVDEAISGTFSFAIGMISGLSIFLAFAAFYTTMRAYRLDARGIKEVRNLCIQTWSLVAMDDIPTSDTGSKLKVLLCYLEALRNALTGDDM
eukprot:gnl/Carplike_NY0171/7502_a10357_233.p1 GENE.gnl/Carplike_NY0171/7502_a10357_233~~gnl/Carplike_NY0171/7502_a10357_233.p1  ORF type:complete len:368 (-),score=134.34 gnl/Carplike_NY0171/7502_a10357_233:193-1191(-)